MQKPTQRSYPAVVVYEINEDDSADNNEQSPIVYAREDNGDCLMSIQCYGDAETDPNLSYTNTPTLPNAAQWTVCASA